jgi:high affinity Mn2+ porin
MSLLHKTIAGLAIVAAFCVPLLGRAQDRAAETETLGAHYQLTYIWQTKPGFRAAYTGPNSLVPEREYSNTLTATAYFGFRPWVGGEIYFNPEVTQGQAFSNLAGLGGFTNGEVTRASSSSPQLYRQRLFLRQTWNRGGTEEQQPSDINQLAGLVDKNRFVLTVGNFSTLDVFDNNAYAKDPRRQFMNWGNMSYAAYDYAADARGFGWGIAGEWYQGDWVLRLGRMTGPVTPNDLPVDFDILNHYGDQFEVEHAHELAGQPGKVRVLAWRNRAVLARFRDAINYGLANSQTPDIFKVRNSEQFKYGLGVNVEQALSKDLGVFFRAMQTDGATETYAFTEVDQSIAAGVSLQGSGWGRPVDTLGVSLMQNGLSQDRREYLEAGGISFFIGDGRLQYQPETIFELYYSMNITRKTFITLDYQRIYNPAYNADRGPVDFGAVRLHAEF